MQVKALLSKKTSFDWAEREQLLDWSLYKQFSDNNVRILLSETTLDT